VFTFLPCKTLDHFHTAKMLHVFFLKGKEVVLRIHLKYLTETNYKKIASFNNGMPY